MDVLRQQLEAAIEKRRPLLADATVNACRILHGAADGIAGLVIEKLADVLIVQIHEGQLRLPMQQVQSLAESACQILDCRCAYLKRFTQDRSRDPAGTVHQLHHDPQPLVGSPAPPSFTVHEWGLDWEIHPYDGFSTGLFLEQRENRRRIRQLADGKRVLNTFAYTCSFSVAAAAGGAAEVHSVDLSKRYLEWGKRNFALNSLDSAPHRFFWSDTLDFYTRALRQNRRYDLIIIDPPTFSRQRRPKRNFVLQEQLPNLLTGAIALLNPGGTILLSTNDCSLPLARMKQELNAAAGTRAVRILDQPRLPLDFAGDPDYAKSLLAVVE